MGEEPTVAVIKHANPCGVSSHHDITEAYIRANACDPVSAFGGIVAVNKEVSGSMADESLIQLIASVVLSIPRP